MIWVLLGLFIMIVSGGLAVEIPYLGIPIMAGAMALSLYGITKIKDETWEEFFRKRPNIDD